MVGYGTRLLTGQRGITGGDEERGGNRRPPVGCDRTSTALLAEGHATSAVSVSPTMTKWVAIPYAARAADWDALMDEARQFVRQSTS